MKTLNVMLAAVVLSMLGAAGCAALGSKAEQEEIISEVQKEQDPSLWPQQEGRWLDANGWENDLLNDGD